MKSDSNRSLAFRIRQIIVSLFCLFAVVCIISSLYTLSNSHSSNNKRKRSIKPRSLPENVLGKNKVNSKQKEILNLNDKDDAAAKLAEVEKQANIEDVTDNENENSESVQLNLAKLENRSHEKRHNKIKDDAESDWKEIDINATVNLNYDNAENEETGIEPVTFDEFSNRLLPKKTSLKLNEKSTKSTESEKVDDSEKNVSDENSGDDSVVTETQSKIKNKETKSLQETAAEIIRKLSSAHDNIDQIQDLIAEDKSNKSQKINKTQKKRKNKKITKNKVKTKNISNETKQNKIDTSEGSGGIEEIEKGTFKILSKNKTKKPLTTKEDLEDESQKIIDNEKRLSQDEDIENENKEKEEKTRASSGNDNFPFFPENYHATGLLLLPHSKIAEPFEIWYAPSVKKSRIDYYYGTDKTIQRGDLGDNGEAFKYVPMYTDRKGSYDGCWSLTGNKYRPIIPQVITPNLTWFKYDKTEVYTGALTTKWSYEYYAFGMRNLQHVWVTKEKPYRPIRYEMFGFDMMLGSYYDHYVIEYVSFEDWNVNEKRFDLPQDIKCSNWSTSLETNLIVNPMMEFTAFSPEQALDIKARYLEYKQRYDEKERERKKEKELIKRMHIFKHNIRYINSHNRRNLPFKLKTNSFLDMKPEELDMQHGNLENDTANHPGIKDPEEADKYVAHRPDIPEEVDWRDYGAVSGVKGQATCGACYAFTAAGVAEGAWFIKTGKAVEVSSQQLVDCSWGIGNHGCKGGHYAAALSWIYSHGISTSKSYGKYLGQEGYCHFNDTWFGAKIDGFYYVPPYNITALKYAIVKYGPVAVSLNTFPLSFKFYSHGVYSDPKCLSNRTQHSAIVVGFGKQNGKEYWLVKNSWSSTWGEDGYIKIAIKDHICGVTQYPVAAVMSQATFKLPMQSKLSSDVDEGLKIPHTSRNNIDSQQHNKTKNNLPIKITALFEPINKTTGINKAANEKVITTSNRITIQISKPKNLSADSYGNPNNDATNASPIPTITVSVDKKNPRKKVFEIRPGNPVNIKSNANNISQESLTNPNDAKVGEDSEVHPSVNFNKEKNALDDDGNEYEKMKYVLQENEIQNKTKAESGHLLSNNTSLTTNPDCKQAWVKCTTYGKNIYGLKSFDTDNKQLALVTDEHKTKSFESDGDVSNKIKVKPTKVVYENEDDNGFIVSREDQLKTNEIDEPNEHTNIVEAPPEVDDAPSQTPNLSAKEVKLQQVKDALKHLADKQSAETGMNVIKLPASPKIKEIKKPKKKSEHKTSVIPFFGLHIKDEDEPMDADNASKSNEDNTSDNYAGFNDLFKEKNSSSQKQSVKNIVKNMTSTNKTNNENKENQTNSKIIAVFDSSAVNTETKNRTNSNDNETPSNLAETVSNINEMNLSTLEMGDHINNKNNRTFKDPSLSDERFEEISTHLVDLRKEVFNESDNLIMPTERLFNNPSIEKDNEMKEQKFGKQIKSVDNSIKTKKPLVKPNKAKVHKKEKQSKEKQSKEKQSKEKQSKEKQSKEKQSKEKQSTVNLKIYHVSSHVKPPSHHHKEVPKTIQESIIPIVTKTTPHLIPNINTENSLTKVENTPSMKSKVQNTPKVKIEEALKKVIRKLPLLHVAQHMYHHVVQKEKQKKTEEIKQKVLEHEKEFHQFVKELKTKHLKIDNSWNKPTLDPEKIGTFLDERLKQKNSRIRPEQATLLGSKKHIIAKHESNGYEHINTQKKSTRQQEHFVIPNFSQANSQDMVSKYGMQKSSSMFQFQQQPVKKKIEVKKKLNNVDKAFQESMDFLYHRIDHAVEKKTYK